ncbi:DUF6221 family protein [Streptomyces microflavus]|uniref:DUF6221 family protein n=1 Tax=Streptomyces microflavus TaxID=1919 RepID=UPI00340BCB40
MEPQIRAGEHVVNEATMLAFWRARLDEDERAARRAGDTFRQIGETGVIVATEGDRAEECASANWAGIAEHIVRHDPARVLHGVEAARKRLTTLSDAIEAGHDSYDLASTLLPYELLPYTDHPDYNESWRP